ncbi:aminoglycoside phosphotransferase family protein [Bacillus sp. FJAT-27245]|uniref:aminoglycoside phosphotransferase family protein n=1 Tax=Bacillus sp. FJAT-27245 TaxID=1684144 RepID=UPI0006A78F8F|nr:aminoglycoside phosphotransferase family protein [Bacillus sp. FJAT-27245]
MSFDKLDLPKDFITKITGAFGEEGEKWLAGLDGQIMHYTEKWELAIESPVPNLSYNYVTTAKDADGTPVILKLGVPNRDFKNEIQAIKAYNGNSFARLLAEDAENGAMLLERLVPGQNLSKIEDEEQATREYITVWKKIRTPIPKAGTFPSIMDWASGLERYRAMFPKGGEPIPFKAVDTAAAFFKELAELGEEQLLHGDLHHENILYAEGRGWVAIDPKGVTGHPYFDIVSFLVNYVNEKPNPKELLKLRVDLICNEFSMDRQLLLKAAIALATLYACWCVEDKTDWENTYQCVLWFRELLEESASEPAGKQAQI